MGGGSSGVEQCLVIGEGLVPSVAPRGGGSKPKGNDSVCQNLSRESAHILMEREEGSRMKEGPIAQPAADQPRGTDTEKGGLET